MDRNEKFKNNFKLEQDHYFGTVNMTDVPIGFGVYRKTYKKNYASLIKVWITKENLENNCDLKSITININYGLYDKEEKSLLVAGEKVKTHIIKDPVNLISKDDFYYDSAADILYNDKKKELTGNQILEYVYNNHIKPTKPIRGFWIRSKLILWRIILKNTFLAINKLFISLIYIISGTKYKGKVSLYAGFGTGTTVLDENKKFEERKNIKIFEYEAPFWTVIFYSILHLLIYFIFSYINFYPKTIVDLIQNNFLTILYVIISLSFFEKVLPNFLKKLIIKSSKLYWSSYSKSIKI